MQFLVRYLLWILMAVLPLQGGAAVFAACKTQAAGASAGHGCHEPDAVADGTSGGMQAHDGAHTYAKAHGKCSTCASCCTAATAPPHAVILPAPFPRADRALPAAEPAIAAIFPSGLERPPRAA
jgi:hypothetical protein